VKNRDYIYCSPNPPAPSVEFEGAANQIVVMLLGNPNNPHPVIVLHGVN